MIINLHARNCIVSTFQIGLPQDAELNSDDTLNLFEVYSAVRDPLIPVLGIDAFDWIIGDGQ